jgi:hypothetical protein
MDGALRKQLRTNGAAWFCRVLILGLFGDVVANTAQQHIKPTEFVAYSRCRLPMLLPCPKFALENDALAGASDDFPRIATPLRVPMRLQCLPVGNTEHRLHASQGPLVEVEPTGSRLAVVPTQLSVGRQLFGFRNLLVNVGQKGNQAGAGRGYNRPMSLASPRTRGTLAGMRRINFETLPVLELAEGVRCQTALLDGRQFRLIEFAPGFCEKEWCSKAHIGYVLAGRLEVEFDNEIEVFSLGDGLVIDAGEVHRARVIAGPVRIFLVEDARQDADE